MRGGRWLRWALGGILGYALLASLALHPFLAVTHLSGGHALVVEGWMPDAALRSAAALAADGGYGRVAVTGAVRPFAYYLRSGDSVEVRFSGARSGRLTVRLVGVPGARWSIYGGQGMVLTGTATASPRDHEAVLPPTARLLIAAEGAAEGSSAASLYIAGLWIEGRNPHAADPDVRVKRVGGPWLPGAPTYAHLGAQALARAGIPEAAIAVLPTWQAERGRTFGAARDADAWARASGIAAYDVATLGVHARRTWKMHRIARRGAPVGIVSLRDPRCSRWSWWMRPYGWLRMLKETAGLPAPWLVDRLVHDEAGASAPAPR